MTMRVAAERDVLPRSARVTRSASASRRKRVAPDARALRGPRVTRSAGRTLFHALDGRGRSCSSIAPSDGNGAPGANEAQTTAMVAPPPPPKKESRKRQRAEVNHDEGGFRRRGRRLVCNVATCQRTYKKKCSVVHHIARAHTPLTGAERPTCAHCEAVFTTRHELELHTEQSHCRSHGDDALVPLKRFECTAAGCDRAYSKREHLRRHVQATHDAPLEKPFQCALCGVRFVHQYNLTRHHANHHTENSLRRYQCTVCLLRFKKKTHLLAHAFVHTGVLPFACEECGERFQKKFHLTRHERVHLGSTRASTVQVLVCDDPDCEEILFDEEEKREHMKKAHGKHEEEEGEEEAAEEEKQASRASTSTGRQLQCLVCERVFERMQNLRAHLRTHFDTVNDRKLHVCPMLGCDRAYTRQSNVMAHYNAVHDPIKSRRFQCPYANCDGAFGYKKVLQTHIAAVHERQAASPHRQPGAASSSPSSQQQTKAESKRPRLGVLARALGLNQVGDQLR